MGLFLDGGDTKHHAGESAAEHTGMEKGKGPLRCSGLDFLLGDIQNALWVLFLIAITVNFRKPT